MSEYEEYQNNVCPLRMRFVVFFFCWFLLRFVRGRFVVVVDRCRWSVDSGLLRCVPRNGWSNNFVLRICAAVLCKFSTQHQFHLDKVNFDDLISRSVNAMIARHPHSCVCVCVPFCVFMRGVVLSLVWRKEHGMQSTQSRLYLSAPICSACASHGFRSSDRSSTLCAPLQCVDVFGEHQLAQYRKQVDIRLNGLLSRNKEKHNKKKMCSWICWHRQRQAPQLHELDQNTHTNSNKSIDFGCTVCRQDLDGVNATLTACLPGWLVQR